MCGIFGAIGPHINPDIISALALANRERGVDSLGFFNSEGGFVKHAGDPAKCLIRPAFIRFIDRTCKTGWFLAGHTRQATQGSVTTRNAHPFRYGHYIGCHNGIVYPTRFYCVDSEFLIDELNRNGGDYQTAFADIWGYWALTWFDGKYFYLQAYENALHIGCDKTDTWYYSSDLKHLTDCTDKLERVVCVDEGVTIRFCREYPKYEILPAFVSHRKAYKELTGKKGDDTCSPFDGEDDWADKYAWERLGEYEDSMEEWSM